MYQGGNSRPIEPTVYGFYRTIRVVLFLVLITAAGLWACVHVIRGEFAREKSYQQQYGDRWVDEYTNAFSSLNHAHTRIGIAIVGIAAILSACIWLIKVMRDSVRSSQKLVQQSQHRELTPERRVRYKRNALLGVYFGVPTILFSVVLAIFRMGIFEEHSEETSLAIFIYLAGYAAVIWGCYWWLRAKNWSEAVLIIAFMPLIVFFIPFVRLLVLKVLGLLVAAMVMSPLILVVVVAALPDKSGHNRSRAPWERRRSHRRRRSRSRDLHVSGSRGG
jgi:hypothetical protein